MKWLRVASGIADDVKVWELAGMAGCDAFAAIGHLVTLWGVMTEQAKTGDLSRVPDAMLELWARWTGERGRFARAVRTILCDEHGVITAWERYQGAAIREAESDRKRADDRRKAARTSGHRQAERPGDRPADHPPDRPADRPTLRNETIRDERTTQQPSTAPRVTDEVDDAVRPRLPAEYRPDLDALLAAVGSDRRASWLRGMAAKLDGLHPPAVAPDVLGEALRAFAANGAELRWKLFEGYLRRAAERPPPAAGLSVALVPTRPNGQGGHAPTRTDRIVGRSIENTVAALAALKGRAI